MIDATILLDKLKHSEVKLVTAESCTGGLLSAVITNVPGASSSLERGFVTYSNESKTEMLGVPKKLIAEHGAVSKEVAIAMAEGALKHSHADISVAITGIAGPDGGSKEKPVGLVYIAVSYKGKTRAIRHHFSGNRTQVRQQSVEKAFSHLLSVAL